MKLTRILFLTILTLALFSPSFCDEYNITKVSEWKFKDSTNDSYKIYLIPSIVQRNSQTLQFTNSKIVALLYGQKSEGQSQIDQQLAVIDSDGNVLHSAVFENAQDRYFSNLSPTNVDNEFLFIYNQNNQIYITFYDEKLKVKRGTQNKSLGTVGTYDYFNFPIISMGKDLMYIILFAHTNQNVCIQVYVLDLSNISTYNILETHTYTGYSQIQFNAYTIQAYSDDTATAHFYALNSQNESTLVQLQYNSSGALKSGFPKQTKKEIAVNFYNGNWKWDSILHKDSETSTFITNDFDDSKLMIYTYTKDGNEICSQIVDINGYYSINYYYGIQGNKGWIYLQDVGYQQGYFTLFDPKTCKLSLTNLKGTQISQGTAGTFFDNEKEKILILEYGNLFDTTNQKNVQSKIYQIGSFEKTEDNENENEDEDESSYLIGFQGLIALIGLIIII